MPVARRPPDLLLINRLKSIELRVSREAQAGRAEGVWREVEALRGEVQDHEEVAYLLARIVGQVDEELLSRDTRLEVLWELHRAYPRDPRLLGLIGRALEATVDVWLLNAPPPEDPLFERIVQALTKVVKDVPGGSKEEKRLLSGLATAARNMGRQQDAIAEQALRRLVRLSPNDPAAFYNLGLFLKTRGRFLEAMQVYQAARPIPGKTVDEAYEINLAVCATGAGEGAVALEVWQRLGEHIEIGRFGLPDGCYHQCKVQLAQRPRAQRSAGSDHPGMEETVWIERLSPCHGIIRSVLCQDLGVDYGDVVLFDPCCAITVHQDRGRRIPVFPHLVTLFRNHYRVFDFAATQQEAGQISDATQDLERDAIIYPHSEGAVASDVNHSHPSGGTRHIVTGRIAAPPDMDPGELLQQVDAAISLREPCRLYAPALCEAAGQTARAAVEKRRYDMIKAGS